jgi:hypothetical protein
LTDIVSDEILAEIPTPPEDVQLLADYIMKTREELKQIDERDFSEFDVTCVFSKLNVT